MRKLLVPLSVALLLSGGIWLALTESSSRPSEIPDLKIPTALAPAEETPSDVGGSIRIASDPSGHVQPVVSDIEEQATEDERLSTLVRDPLFAEDLVHSYLEDFKKESTIGTSEEILRKFPALFARVRMKEAQGHSLFCVYANGHGMMSMEGSEGTEEDKKALSMTGSLQYATTRWQLEVAEDEFQTDGLVFDLEGIEEAHDHIKRTTGYVLVRHEDRFALVNMLPFRQTDLYQRTEEDFEDLINRLAIERDTKVSTTGGSPISYEAYFGKE